ncbi:hypothetical protein [Streptomyces sp. NPDC060022]|uniref:hypothetical protein n=1 Tax=Streptomyces sp. NPDC060022 TaxID=3347039 RepID=UPI00368833A0
MSFSTTGGRKFASAPRRRMFAALLTTGLMGIVSCQAPPQPAPDEGLRIGPRVQAPEAVTARLAATFADRPSAMSTVPLTGEDPHRTAAAVAVLRNTGRPEAATDLVRRADWWSDRVLATPENDAALHIQHLRAGIQAFGSELDPDLVRPAASAAVRALLLGRPALPDVEAAARLADEIHRTDPGNARWKEAGTQVRGLVAGHLEAQPRACRVTGTSDVLSDYVAARTLAGLGFPCTVGPRTGEAVRAEISRLVKRNDSWSVPEAVLLLQVSGAARSDGRQDAGDVETVGRRAQDALRDALAGNGPYYRKASASLTELAVASTALASLPGRPPVAVTDATAEAMADIALLRGRISDQPDDNSAVDGYLATVAQAQLTGTAAGLGDIREPAPTAPLREQVRFFLQASLRAEPLPSKDILSRAKTELKRTKDPLDRITVTTSATLALLRTDRSCAVLDHDTPLLRDALKGAVEQYAQGSDAVKAWLTLLWSTTAECGGFQKETAAESSSFLEQLKSHQTADNPTAQAVTAWSSAELACSKGAEARAARARPVGLPALAGDSDPGEGLGLGTYAALRTREMAASPCSGDLRDKLKG